jgi:hypothetical protein
MLTTAPASRARRMPDSVAAAMSASVRLLEQTWKAAMSSKHASVKSRSRKSRSAAGGR